MTGDHRGFGANRVEKADHIPHQMQDCVLLDGLRTVGLPIASHIRGYDMEAGGGEGRDLVPPGIPGFREAMTQDHQRTGSGFSQMHPDAVRLDHPVGD